MSTQQTAHEQNLASPSLTGVFGWLRTDRRWLLATGLAFGATSIGLYAADGYSLLMLLLWLAGLGALLAYFALITERLPRLARADLVVPLGVLLVFGPLYLVWSATWPVQVNSDEVVVMVVSQRWGHASGIDPFGLAPDLFNVPALLFVVWGHLGDLLGGVDLQNSRILHGISGLLAVGASFFFFRQLLPRRWAIFAVVVLGVNHALFMLSRMALRDNTALLAEVLALTLLLYGLRRDAALPTFVGGLALGAAFYVYYPSRGTLVVWALFLAGLALFFRRTMSLRRIARFGGIAASGFALVALPLLIAEQHASDRFQRESSLLFPEGREIARIWANGHSTWDGISQNILYGLSAFNNDIVDHGWLYPNWGHGFLDPLTGVLLWIGVIVVGWKLVRRRGEPWPLLPLIGFLTAWLSLSFVINKAPDYTRMLIALPFVAYLATSAVRAAVGLLPRVFGREQTARRRWVAPVVACAVLAGVVAWNVTIASDFVDTGRATGDDIGSTGRYIESRSGEPGITFAMATNNRWPYYVWGYPWMWLDRMRIFAGSDDETSLVSPSTAARFKATPPFALFMSRALWDRVHGPLHARYPIADLRNITPDGRLVVFEQKKAV